MTVLALAGDAFAQGPAAAAPAPNQAVFTYRGADRDARLVERARREGSVSVYTSLAPTEAGPIVEAFEKKYGIKVQMWRGLSDGVVQRVISEARAKRHAVDVVETNGPEMESLAREQVLGEFYSPYFADLPPKTIPKHGLWVPDRLNFFVVAYNTAKVKPADLPKTYEGFLDPKWKGRIALESTDAEWMGGVVKAWGNPRGMAFFNKLGETRPSLRKGHVLLAQLIASGEVEVGLTAYHANVQSFKKRGAPIDWAPVEPVIARPQGIGVARFAPHPHAALLFADFMLSPEAQEMLAGMGRSPSSRVVKSDTSNLVYVMSDPAVVLDENDKWQLLWDKLFAGK
ncbi:MAG: extracellular solute-binding protein [Pseudomonadota bacterium]|nr:extracellular solute-binding protein [Pseudomonadota bacterium]